MSFSDEHGADIDVDSIGQKDDVVEPMDADDDVSVEEDNVTDPNHSANREGEEDDENVPLEFYGQVDPLSLLDDTPEGFEQFQKLEFETLAARKRKSRFRAGEGGASDRAAVFGADMDEIQKVLEDARGSKGPRRRGRRKGAVAGMSKAVVKKLGEANLFYVTEKYQEAIEVLLEVVKMSPNVPDSYQTLGLIYEAMGNRKKSLQFYLLAAHLTPKDTAQWKRLMVWSKEEGNLRQAMYCITRAVRADREDYEARWERAMLFIEMGDRTRGYNELEKLHLEKPGDPELAHQLSRMFHKMDQPERAVRVLETLIDQHSENASLTSVNILAELHMGQGSFQEAVRVIERARAELEKLSGVSILPLDLEVKEAICFVYLGDLGRAQVAFDLLLNDSIEDYYDLLQDCGNALLAVNAPLEAIKFFFRLKSSANFDTPNVWIKVGQCYAAMGNIQEGIATFEKVLSAVPHHADSRIALADLYLKSKQLIKATSILKPSQEELGAIVAATEEGTYEESTPWWRAPKVRLRRARLHFECGHLDAFLAESIPLINETVAVEKRNLEAMNAYKKKYPNWVKKHKFLSEESQAKEGIFQEYEPPLPRNMAVRAYMAKKRAEQGPSLAMEDNDVEVEAETADDMAHIEDINPPEPPPEPVLPPLPGILKDDISFDLVFKSCKVLRQFDRENEGKSLATSVLQVARKVKKARKLKLRALFGGSKEGEVDFQLDRIRELISEQPHCNAHWNAFYRRLQVTGEPAHRHFRYLTRFASLYQAPLILGHQRSVSGFSQGAMRDYLKAFQLQPNNAFVCLCCGTAMLSLSAGSRIPNRNQCVLQAFAFMYKYANLADNSQEANYNLGRAFQQVGLPHLAVDYYQKVLLDTVTHSTCQSPPAAEGTHRLDPGLKVADGFAYLGCCDLKKEAAHNLALIYKSSGAGNLARQLYKDFVTI